MAGTWPEHHCRFPATAGGGAVVAIVMQRFVVNNNKSIVGNAVLHVQQPPTGD